MAPPSHGRCSSQLHESRASHEGSGHDGVRQSLVHTGQHYGANIRDVFFRELDFPEPGVNPEVGSGGQAWQTAEIMSCFEPAVWDSAPDLVAVCDDVNSIVETALVRAKPRIPIAYAEAGLRSMLRRRLPPGEIRRDPM